MAELFVEVDLHSKFTNRRVLVVPFDDFDSGLLLESVEPVGEHLANPLDRHCVQNVLIAHLLGLHFVDVDLVFEVVDCDLELDLSNMAVVTLVLQLLQVLVQQALLPLVSLDAVVELLLPLKQLLHVGLV